MSDAGINETRAFVAEMGEAPELDLHERTADEATREADAFLNQAFVAGQDAVRIVHGRGSGILRDVVHRLLTDHPLVVYFRDAQSPGQLGGMTVAVLQKR